MPDAVPDVTSHFSNCEAEHIQCRSKIICILLIWEHGEKKCLREVEDDMSAVTETVALSLSSSTATWGAPRSVISTGTERQESVCGISGISVSNRSRSSNLCELHKDLRFNSRCVCVSNNSSTDFTDNTLWWHAPPPPSPLPFPFLVMHLWWNLHSEGVVYVPVGTQSFLT